MDYRTCDEMKKYNALLHKTQQKEAKIESLKKEYHEICKAIEENSETESGTNKEGRRLRNLENQLDKVQLKIQEAENIGRTYQQIKDKLKDVFFIIYCIVIHVNSQEQITYSRCLDAMEKQIHASQDELTDLNGMYTDALAARDNALRELKEHEEITAAERRRRDAELISMRRVAEGKNGPSEKAGAHVSFL